MSALEKFDSEALEFKVATEGPEQLLKAMSADGDEFVRDKGFILTARNIVDIRKYEWFALGFPESIVEITHYIGGESDEPGLKVGDFQKTFTMLRDHAKSWGQLENDIRNLGTQLGVFSGTMANHSNALIDLVEKLAKRNGYEGAPRRYAQLLDYYKEAKENDEDFQQFHQLTESDLETKEVLGFVVAKMFTNTVNMSNATLDIYERLAEFHRALKQEVHQQVSTRCEVLRARNGDAILSAIDENIISQREELARLEKEYNDKVRESIGGAVGGIRGIDPFSMIVNAIGGLIMSIYTGIEAESVRARKNELKAELEENITRKTRISKKNGQMDAVSLKLEQANNILEEASHGLGNMQKIWLSIKTETQRSADEIPSITDTLLLEAVATQLREIANPWVNIGNTAANLMLVFREADQLYKSEKEIWI